MFWIISCHVAYHNCLLIIHVSIPHDIEQNEFQHMVFCSFGESSPKFELSKYDLNGGNGILSFYLKERLKFIY
jgi:hypothetical protein